MATGPIETHLHRSFNWENGAPGPREGPRGRSARCGNDLFAQCVRLRSEINRLPWVTIKGKIDPSVTEGPNGSCGEIGTVFAGRSLKQPLFHRNLFRR